MQIPTKSNPWREPNNPASVSGDRLGLDLGWFQWIRMDSEWLDGSRRIWSNWRDSGKAAAHSRSRVSGACETGKHGWPIWSTGHIAPCTGSYCCHTPLLYYFGQYLFLVFGRSDRWVTLALLSYSFEPWHILLYLVGIWPMWPMGHIASHTTALIHIAPHTAKRFLFSKRSPLDIWLGGSHNYCSSVLFNMGCFGVASWYLALESDWQVK